MNIRNMNLNEFNPHSHQRISYRNRSMRIRTRINQYPIYTFPPRGVNTVYQGAFVVTLEGEEGGVVRGCEVGGGGFDVSEGFVAVDLGFSGTEKIQVWAMDEEKFHLYQSEVVGRYC
jgi:hypothetical protein